MTTIMNDNKNATLANWNATLSFSSTAKTIWRTSNEGLTKHKTVSKVIIVVCCYKTAIMSIVDVMLIVTNNKLQTTSMTLMTTNNKPQTTNHREIQQGQQQQ